MDSNQRSSGIVKTLVIFFILLFVYAKWGPAIPFSSVTQSRGEPLIVTGEGKITVSPDIAKVTLGVQETGTSLKTVQASVNTKSKALTDAVKNLGVEEKDIKTTSYNVFPQYDFTGSTQRITGYQVSTNYEVTVKDFDKVNDVIVAGTQSGGNVVGDVRFEINDETKKEKLQEARETAVKDAREKAEGLAKSAGITLGKVINVSESQGVGIYPERSFALPTGAGGDLMKEIANQPDIQPGTTEISTFVSLSFEIR